MDNLVFEDRFAAYSTEELNREITAIQDEERYINAVLRFASHNKYSLERLRSAEQRKQALLQGLERKLNANTEYSKFSKVERICNSRENLVVHLNNSIK